MLFLVLSLATASAAVEVSAGRVGTHSALVDTPGLRLGVRGALTPDGAYGLEGGLVRRSGGDRPSELTHILHVLAWDAGGDVPFVQPLRYEPLAGTLELDRTFGAAAGRRSWAGGIRLRAGVRVGSERFVVSELGDGTTDVPGRVEETFERSGVLVGPNGGVDFLLWMSRRVAARAGTTGHAYHALRPDYDPEPGNQVMDRSWQGGWALAFSLTVAVGRLP